MALKRKLIQCLKKLNDVKFLNDTERFARFFKAEDTLYTIFQVGIEREHFTADEKKEIGSLMVHAIKPIEKDIVGTAYLYDPSFRYHAILKKRSALQFLIDDYKDFPVENTTLSKKFAETSIQECINLLDAVIMPEQEFPDSDADETYAEASKVPASHTWWLHNKC